MVFLFLYANVFCYAVQARETLFFIVWFSCLFCFVVFFVFCGACLHVRAAVMVVNNHMPFWSEHLFVCACVVCAFLLTISIVSFVISSTAGKKETCKNIRKKLQQEHAEGSIVKINIIKPVKDWEKPLLHTSWLPIASLLWSASLLTPFRWWLLNSYANQMTPWCSPYECQ